MKEQPSFYSTEHAITEISQSIKNILDGCGIYYRIFARCKKDTSTLEKLEKKKYSHESGYLMQDYLGVRITLYYHDDIPICQKLIENHFSVVGRSISEQDSKTFSPVHLNIVCKIPDDTLRTIEARLWNDFPFDKTFEIQIRTVFSEGWHEIEHDIRYKHQEDWGSRQDLARNLNGLLATLETCDWSIVAIINDLAYREYKDKQWNEMLRNKLRIHLADGMLSSQICDLLDADSELAKSVYRCDRQELLVYLSNQKKKIPLNANNMIYLINHLFIHNEALAEITPKAMYLFVGQK